MATKYVSSLTGEEMDAALIDMAYHNSEAYAVGTRNGVAVGSSDVTYHNNSKYWAEQVYGYTDRAEDAANRAEAAVPASTEGAVFFSTAQTLTSAQQAQARANIMAGGSNRNLLDNPWFTVRQRGNGAFTSAVYTADRWKNTGANQSTTLTSQGLVIQQVNNGNDGVEQKLPADLSAALVGSALTLSINCLAISGTYRYRMRFFNGSSLISAKFGGITSAGLYSVTMDEVPANTNSIVVDFFTNSGIAGDTITVAAIKLELGSVSTLANDTPPNYAEELAKCQRYFLRITQSTSNAPMGFGVATSPTTALVTIPIPVTMRSDGTITVTATGATTLRFGSSNVTVTSIAFRNIAPNAIAITANVASGLSGNNAVMFMPDVGYILNISADL